MGNKGSKSKQNVKALVAPTNAANLQSEPSNEDIKNETHVMTAVSPRNHELVFPLTLERELALQDQSAIFDLPMEVIAKVATTILGVHSAQVAGRSYSWC